MKRNTEKKRHSFVNVSFFTFLLQNITKDNIISNDNMERKADII